MMSLVPFIIAAGFLESYVTHNYQDLPNWSKWMLIMMSFGIILFFYVFYPIYVARKHPELVDNEQVGHFVQRSEFDYNKIRSVGEVISDAFRMYRLQFKKLAPILLLIVLPLMAGIVAWQDYRHYDLQQVQYWYDWSSQLEFMIGYGFHDGMDGLAILLWSLVFVIGLSQT